MKLFKIFRQLSNREQLKFQSFVEASAFNKRQDVIQLLALMIRNSRKKPDSQSYWEAIYPKRSFNVSRWHLLTSRLFKLLEEYLAIDQVRKRDTDRGVYLAKAYQQLGEKAYFEKTVEDCQDTLTKRPLRNIAFLQQQHDLAYEKYDFILSMNRKEPGNLQEVSDYLDHYFMAAKLRQACHATSREVIREEQYHIHFITDIVRLIEQDPSYLSVPAIAVYYYCYRSISEQDNEQYFVELRRAIDAFQGQFSPTEMRDIYTIAINYSIRRLNTGATHYIREAFELYLMSLKQGFLVDKGIMQDSTYTDLVSLACKLEEFDWAESFIQDHQSDLSLKTQKPLYHYSLGKLYYEKGLPDESLKQLILVDAKASFIFLGARVIQLKIYYEEEEFDLLESLLESLRVYLQRSKNLAYRKAHYLNILTFTRQLLLLPTMTKAEKLDFRNRIQSAAVFGERDWFLKMVAS